MGIFDLLDKLRSRPQPIRRMTAIFLTLVIGTSVVVLWLVTFNLKSGIESSEDKKEEYLEPFRVIGENFKSVYQSMISNLDKLYDE